MNMDCRRWAFANKIVIATAAMVMMLSVSGCAFLTQTFASSDDGDLPPEAKTITSEKPVKWQDLDDENQDKTPEKAQDPRDADSLWVRLRKQFKLPEAQNKRMQIKRNWYRAHPEYITRVFQRAKPYLYYITTQLEAHNMPVDLALLPVVESAFNPFAYSRSGASGLWQFMPVTGRRFGLNRTWWHDGRRDIMASTQAAMKYLQRLHDRFNSWLLALAAYNSGGGRVARAVRKNKRLGRPTDFWHLDLPRQTRAYVPWLLAVRDIVSNPKKYGVTLNPIPNTPYLTTVPIDSQIEVARAAKMAGLSVKQMYLLNPTFSQWVTPPGTHHKLVIPLAQRADFVAELAALPDNKRVQWAHHRIRSGETLSTIAYHYGTTVTALKRVNHLRSNVIRAGHYLMVPNTPRGLSKTALKAVRKMRGKTRTHQGNKVYYRVLSGDSLWLIAKRHGVSARKIAKWNHIGLRSTLRVGKRLVIWQRHAPKRTGKTQYTVRRGDSLWTISQHYGVTMAELASWNGIKKSSTLSIGQTLVVWPHGHHGSKEVAEKTTDVVAQTGDNKIHYVVRTGDSLWSISNQFDVNVTQIASWNQLSVDDYLKPGQKLVLYVDEQLTSNQS